MISLSLLLIIICINVIVLAYVLSKKRETFVATPLLVYDVTINTKNLTIVCNPKTMDYSSKFDSTLSGLKNIIMKPNIPNKGAYLLYTDTFTYLRTFPHHKVLTIIGNDEKTLIFVKPKNAISQEGLIDTVRNRKTIGYVNDIDKTLFRFLANILDLKPNDTILKKVALPKTKKIDQGFFATNRIYALLMFTPLSNDKMIPSLFSDEFKIDFLNYADALYSEENQNRLKFMLPYSKLVNHDFRVRFPGIFTDDKPVRTCLGFDMLLCGKPELENNIDLGYELNKLLVRISNYDVINYYTMYFGFFKQTTAYIDSANKHIIMRDDLPILEQFSDTIDIEIDKNIDGYYDSLKGTLELRVDKLDNLPLLLNSKIILLGQDREEENGVYYVIETTPSRTILRKNIWFTSKTKRDTNGLFPLNGITKLNGRPISDIKENDDIYIENAKTRGRIYKPNQNMAYIKPLAIKSEDATKDPRYECYNIPYIKSKGLCESAYDEMGNPKKMKTVWDRPCEKNAECPFYQANKNYKNYFGGCTDGHCQMPIGVRRVSYRKYDPASKPMCYNCKDKSNIYCCGEQKNKDVYPDLASPDYAFPLDSYERMQQIKGKRPFAWYFQ